MIQISTVLRFLCFDADAIKQIAGSRSVTWLGLLFVLSAGFAREYDGEYLVAEPWHLLIPMAASLIGCLAMTSLVYFMARSTEMTGLSFPSAFRHLLNVYWMTAPLAWLYAIPVERFLSPTGATTANLSFLAIVAIWRVALIIRCIQVMYNARILPVIATVLLFCDVLVLVAMLLIPSPVFMIMGGIRLTDSENLILGVRVWTWLIGLSSLLIWAIAYFTFLFKSSLKWTYFVEDSISENRSSVRYSLWGVAVASLLIWLAFLPFTQPEQRLRWKTDNLVRAGDFAELSLLTHAHTRSEFPPHWTPAPRLGYGEREPKLENILLGLHNVGAAQWFIDEYWSKFGYQVIDRLGSRYSFIFRPEELSDRQLSSFADILEADQKGSILAQAYFELFVEPLMHDDDLYAERRNILRRFKKIAQMDHAD